MFGMRTDSHDGGTGSAILVIGAGAIGTAMATVMADAGHMVTVAEPDAERRAALVQEVLRRHRFMMQAGLARGAADAAAARVAAAADMADAPVPALVLEAGPERLEAKQAIFAALRAAFGPEVPIATLSSAIPVSRIVPDPAGQAACLAAHPANPPTLVRILEITPAPGTREGPLSAALGILRGAGFDPIPLGREIPGFVFNRLQGAVLREAYRLLAEGVIDVAGLDTLVRDGLGLRWALSGPFETVELNTAGGLAAHAARMGPAYAEMGEARGETDCIWPEDLVADAVRQRRALVPETALEARMQWREEALAALIAARRPILSGGGE